jgi:hypothetical protein
MSLDIHVMPFSAFLAGEYTTAAERLAAQLGVPLTRTGNPKAQFPPQEARQVAGNVRRWLEQRTLNVEAWADEGEIAFSEQFTFEAWHAVREFAAHCEFGSGEFEMAEGFGGSPLLRRALSVGTVQFAHLLEHDDNSGLYAPIDFKRPLRLPGNELRVGSTTKLLFELAALRERLGEFPDWAGLKSGERIDDPHPGRSQVKYGIAFLYAAAWTSLQTRLPVIFDG